MQLSIVRLRSLLDTPHRWGCIGLLRGCALLVYIPAYTPHAGNYFQFVVPLYQMISMTASGQQLKKMVLVQYR